MSKNSSYWSFWKVVIAGWSIRYPRQMAQLVLLFMLILFGMIVSCVDHYSDTQTPEVTERVAK